MDHTNQATNQNLVQDVGCWPRLIRAAFIPGLVMVIFVPKGLRFLEQQGIVNMDEITSILTGTFIIGLCFLAIPTVWATIVAFQIIAHPRTVDTTGVAISDAPVTWIIPQFLGWIYVFEGEQIGIVGQQTYTRSGIFTYWPFNPKRIKLFSLQERVEQLVTEAITQNGDRVSMTVEAKYRVRSRKAAQVIRRSADPYADFAQSLRAIVEGFIRGTHFDILYEQSDQIRQQLSNRLISEMQDEYEMRVIGVKISGNKVDERDRLARQFDQLANAQLTAQINAIVAEPELRAAILRKLIDIHGAAAIAGSTDLKSFMQDIQQFLPASSIISNTGDSGTPPPTSRSAPKILPNFVSGQSISALVEPPLQLVSENQGQHQLTYLSYRILLSTLNFPSRTLLEIQNPMGEIVFKSHFRDEQIKPILQKARQQIDDDLNGD